MVLDSSRFAVGATVLLKPDPKAVIVSLGRGRASSKWTPSSSFNCCWKWDIIEWSRESNNCPSIADLRFRKRKWNEA